MYQLRISLTKLVGTGANIHKWSAVINVWMQVSIEAIARVASSPG